VEGMEGLLKLKASLASAEVSAGAVAKADQKLTNIIFIYFYLEEV
jgi:hypothetical protein